MAKRTIVGLFGLISILFAFRAAEAEAAQFQRPDCSAFKDAPLPEASCFRNARTVVRYENYEAVQKAGLEFVYLARPPAGKELDSYPEAKKAAKDKVEGEFRISFSVNAEGNVYDVKVVETSSAPIGALAQLWADTIKQWKFVRIAKPVTDISFRRVYLYSKEDDDSRGNRSGG